jgi:hypothetical protein
MEVDMRTRRTVWPAFAIVIALAPGLLAQSKEKARVAADGRINSFFAATGPRSDR